MAEMLVAEHCHQVTAADGTTLHLKDYLLPMAEARGSIVLMHGLGEHSGRYRHVARFFNDCGLSVRSYDHRGHGRSQGRRGDVLFGDPIIQDAEIILDDFAAHFPDPPFLFGHGMGGLFATRFALARVSPLRGLILSSPVLGLRLPSSARILLDILFRLAPFLGVPNGLSPRFLSHDLKVVAAYKADPLVHGKISARLLRSMRSAIHYCQAQAPTLALPTLMMVAGDDQLVDCEGSRRFFDMTPPGAASMKIYRGFYHEVLSETDAQRPFADLQAWLTSQLAEIS